MVKKLSTKKKILNEAIKQFNESGIPNISSRHIAAPLGISYGNLDYHYKNKEELLLAIYNQMREEMTASYQSRDNQTNVFQHFFNVLLFLEAFQYKYRFFNQDVLELVRTYPKISKLLKKTLELRKDQMQQLFDEFVQEGYIFQKSNVTYERLQHTFRIIITFWSAKQEIITNNKLTAKGEMTQHIWDLLKPHMTEKGIKVYESLVSTKHD